jgi:hypothetical protein
MGRDSPATPAARSRVKQKAVLLKEATPRGDLDNVMMVLRSA